MFYKQTTAGVFFPLRCYTCRSEYCMQQHQYTICCFREGRYGSDSVHGCCPRSSSESEDCLQPYSYKYDLSSTGLTNWSKANTILPFAKNKVPFLTNASGKLCCKHFTWKGWACILWAWQWATQSKTCNHRNKWRGVGGVISTYLESLQTSIKDLIHLVSWGKSTVT